MLSPRTWTSPSTPPRKLAASKKPPVKSVWYVRTESPAGPTVPPRGRVAAEVSVGSAGAGAGGGVDPEVELEVVDVVEVPVVDVPAAGAGAAAGAEALPLVS